MSQHQHLPERYTPSNSTGEPLPGVFFRCADCHEQLYNISHPSLCDRCHHGIASHDYQGCNASVRAGMESISRCDCFEVYGA